MPVSIFFIIEQCHNSVYTNKKMPENEAQALSKQERKTILFQVNHVFFSINVSLSHTSCNVRTYMSPTSIHIPIP